MQYRLALTTLLCFGLTACKEPTGPLIDQIRERGELVVVTRNAATTYYEGAQSGTGLEYDLARRFARSLGVKLKLVVAKNFSDILPMVERGEADIAAAGLSVTEHRQKFVRFAPSYQSVTPQLVYRQGRRAPKGFEDLTGRLEVVAQSSHAEQLTKLQQQYPDLNWDEAPELESEELLSMVSMKDIDYTVADSNEFSINRNYYPDLRTAFDIGKPEPLAWALEKNTDNSLYQSANRFFNTIEKNGTLDRLLDQYYGHIGKFDYAGTLTFLTHIQNRLPQYVHWFVEGAEQTGEDWHLLAAMGYQESHWNPKAVSPTGVRGIMMLTRNTVDLLGLDNRLDPEQSIIGGARYFSMVKSKLPARIREPDRSWLALAAYNVGFGHLEDARRLTQADGFNPDRWSDVKKHLPLLSKKKWYSRTRHGYARGWEPVRYVENVRKYYDVLLWSANRAQARDTTVPTLPGSVTPAPEKRL